MRKVLGLLFISSSLYAFPVVHPSTATVLVHGSVTITSTDTITCALAAGSTGTLAGCVYTAPPSFQAKNVIAGCPALPNDHIYNTRIDNLPVDANSQTRINNILGGTSAYIQIEVDMPQNIVSSNTATTAMTFLNTPNNNGQSFPLLPFPYLGVEATATPDDYFARDRHILTVSTTTCDFYENYNYYPAGTATGLGCPSCNSTAGVSYNGMSYVLADTDNGNSGGATDAAGMFIDPLAFRYSELKAGHIDHALRFTMSNGYINPSFVWPAVANASSPSCTPLSNCLQYGQRYRLKSSFNIAPYSSTTQVILKALQQYGMFMADGGTTMHIQAARDVFSDTITYQAIQSEMRFGNIASQFKFEQVDESSLMVSSTSGKVNLSNAYVTPSNFAEVVVTKTADSSTETLRIAIQPVTVGTYNIPFQTQTGGLSVMAGTPQFQIPYWVQGSTALSVSCSMTPAVGTLTSGCLYTAPVATAILSTATVIITPTIDSTQPVSFPISVFPADGIRINVGGKSAANSPTPPYDANGNYGPSATGKYFWTDPPGNGLPWSTKQDTSFSQALWVSSNTDPDIGLNYTMWPGNSDGYYSAMVPDGLYILAMGFGIGDPGSSSISGYLESIDVNGTTVFSTTTLHGIMGTTNYVTSTASTYVTVTGGKFYFAIRNVTANTPSLIDWWSLIPSATPLIGSHNSAGGIKASGGCKFR